MLTKSLSTVDRLNHELDAVAGETCGWSCADHHGTNFAPCQRATDHAGAEVLVDVHISRREDGSLLMATESCCAGG